MSCGPAVPICDIRVVDDNGHDVPRGSVGELWVKGPNIIKEYLNRPEATAESITDGYMHTGDLVTVDEEGFITIVDRAKDMLIRGGENIYCVEVEAALYTHPEVFEAAVVAVPHKELGEEVGAVVRLKPGAKRTPRAAAARARTSRRVQSAEAHRAVDAGAAEKRERQSAEAGTARSHAPLCDELRASPTNDMIVGTQPLETHSAHSLGCCGLCCRRRTHRSYSPKVPLPPKGSTTPSPMR